jgi:CBS domain-containing protein
MNLVRDLMTSPAVTASPTSTVARVFDLLESHAISAVPIIDDERLVGVVSTTDLVALVKSGDGGARLVKDVMQSPVLTTSPDAPLDEAGRRMASGRVHRLVVTEGERVVGIISARDLLEQARDKKVAAPISSIMSTPVISIDIGDTVDAAIAKLAEAHVHGLVVLDGSRAVGVFTHAEALSARGLPPQLRARPVEEAMSYETICLDASTPIYRAALHAASMNVRRILAVEGHHVAGVLSCIDLVDALSRA